MDNSTIFQSVFVESPVGMLVLNSDLSIRMANQAFLQLVQEDPTDVSGKPFLDYIHTKHAPEVKKRFALIHKGSRPSFNVDVISSILPPLKMSPSSWWRISFSLVHQGNSAFFIGFIQDVTQQKRNERFLVAEKESSQLAMKAAEKAAKMKSDFLANMSHEIRTPIHTIIGMGELLGETKLDEEQKEYTGQIQFAADVLLELINNVLDFSKIEAGKLNLETIQFNLHHTLESAVELVALEAHKKGIEVGVFLESQVPIQVQGDPVRLRQIVVNLFNNAVKFTSRGEIILSCSATSLSASEVSLTIHVQDTGIGIPGGKLDLLFKEFSQVDSSTTRKFGGTGLGLSIAKSLSEMMNGSIQVESTEGKGSTFTVQVILKQSPTAPQIIAPDLGAKVLVVEDNQKLRDIAASYIREWNCSVDFAETGEQALELLRNAAAQAMAYDVALIDLTLPRMDGWQLASEINSDPEINEIPLVLMSPRGTGSTEAKMKLLHWFDEYIGKPIEKQELLTVIRDILEQEAEVEVLETLPDSTDSSDSTEVLSPRTQSRQAKSHAESHPKSLSKSPSPWAGRSILVAEDHQVNRILFETILSSMEIRVTSVENGRLAVDAVQEKTFDLIFLDIHMPELNGYEASREIRKLKLSTPIIAATANAVKGELDKCLAAGMNGFLGKPFRKRDVEEVLEKWFQPVERKIEQTVKNPPKAPSFDGEELEPYDGSDGFLSFQGDRELEKSAPDQEIREIPDIPITRINPEDIDENELGSDGLIPEPQDPAKKYQTLGVFDSVELLDTFMNQRDTVNSVLKSYLERSRIQILAIRRMITNEDSEGLRSEAHGLKGASMSISAEMLGTLAQDIEEAAIHKDMDTARNLVPLLPKIFKLLVKEITNFLG